MSDEAKDRIQLPEPSCTPYRFSEQDTTYLYENPGIRDYLSFLSSFYANVGVNKEPFHSFQQVARDLASLRES